MKLKLLALTALLLLPLSAGAQRNKKKPAKKAKPAEEEMVEDPRLVQMRASTQQVMFIDSRVVDATDFMRRSGSVNLRDRAAAMTKAVMMAAIRQNA